MAPYRFGVFEFDAPAGELRKQGVKVHLQGQPIEILTLLLEHPGEVVTREELQKRLWPADTFVEFDAGLNAAIKRLRTGLSDDPITPHYVETVPRKGYRFVGNLIGADRGHTDSQTGLRDARLRRQWRWWLLRASVLAVVTMGALAIRSVLEFGKAKPISQGDTILLADFVNRTGDNVFDGTLRQGLAFHLAQSPYFNLSNDDRVRQTLQQMNRPAEEPVVGDVAREVCQRQNLKAMLAGEIVQMGSHYAITLNVVNCSTGESLATEQTEASRKEEVLGAMSRSASRLRSKLGEAIASVRRLDKPLEEATTSSLEALQQFSLGVEMQGRGKVRDSLPYYLRAIEIDPDFALAYMRLGAVYLNLAELEKARKYRARAYELRHRVSERERLRISAGYYIRVTGELEKARETHEQIIALYPANPGTRNNLAVILSAQGDLDGAIRILRQELALFPNQAVTYTNLAFYLALVGQLQEARALLNEQISRGIETSYTYSSLYVIAFLKDDHAGMNQSVEWFKDKPNKYELINIQANVAAFEGKREESRGLRRRAAELAMGHGHAEFSASSLAGAAVNEVHFGNCPRAINLIGTALLRNRSAALHGAAYVYALCAEAPRAEALLSEIHSRSPSNTWDSEVFFPEIRAILETNRGQNAKAIKMTSEIGRYERVSFTPAYTRGMAYLRAGSAKEAATAFQKIAAPASVASRCLGDTLGEFPLGWHSVLAAISHLQLGRAYVLMGDREKAQEAYHRFFQVWKDADPDIPALREAKAEYAKLMSKIVE